MLLSLQGSNRPLSLYTYDINTDLVPAPSEDAPPQFEVCLALFAHFKSQQPRVMSSNCYPA